MRTSPSRTLVVILSVNASLARAATPSADAPLASIVLRQVEEPPSEGEQLYRNYLLNRFGSYTARDPDGPYWTAALALGVAGAVSFVLAAVFGSLAYDEGSKTLRSLSHVGLGAGGFFTSGAGCYLLYLALRDNTFPRWEDEGQHP